jgi:SulP family sulfate permease
MTVLARADRATPPGAARSRPARSFFARFTRSGYGRPELRKDLIAGVTVAAISLPQAMAYALIAGIDPRFGLYSAIVVTALASIFGSSSQLINGPTNAISLVVFSVLAFLDPEARFDAAQAVFLLGIMVGAIQILIAVFRLGDLTRYISESVVLGFMAGAGLLVALSQIGNLLGLADQGNGHQLLVHRLWLTLTGDGRVNPRALGIGAGTVVLVVTLRRLAARLRLPRVDMLLALVAAAGVAAWLGWSRPDTHGRTLLATIGRVPAGLPAPHVPEIKFWWIKEMGGGALAIAFLGLLEALAIAKSIANQTRQELDYNRQCLAEGLANLGGGFFQCLPGSGSLTRSAINHQAGAVSRLSGLVTAATVGLVVLFFAPLARFIPKSALAALLLVTAARLVDWRRLAYALRASRYDAGLVLVTALAAVFLSVEFSILIGVALSIVLFVPRAARLKGTELVVDRDRVIRARAPSGIFCGAVVIYDLEGELFFGAAPELERYFQEIKARVTGGARVVVLRVRRARNPDLVCMERLEELLHELEAQRVTVLLCGVRDDFARAMRNLRFHAWLPAERVFASDPQAAGSSTVGAVRRAYALAGQAVGQLTCEHCQELGPATERLYYMI